MNTYARGNLVRVSGSFADETGAALDPATVKCAVLPPGGLPVIHTYSAGGGEIVRSALGEYHMDIDANAPGEYHYRWYSSGSGQAAAESYFLVAPSRFAGD